MKPQQTENRGYSDLCFKDGLLLASRIVLRLQGQTACDDCLFLPIRGLAFGGSLVNFSTCEQ